MNELSQIVGQREATRRLLALFDSGRFPHALLLEGPDSVGKTTTARLLAKILLCSERPSPGVACDHCHTCKKVEAHSHADLSEAPSDERMLKVDHVRELEAVLRLRPVEGGPKVVIIPDAHRMNPPAQNALLKTLEEPPGRSHLILTSSRLRTLLPTVVSRCQRVPFAPLPTAEIARVVADRRQLGAEESGLIAALAHGSLGRALTLELPALRERRELAIALDQRAFGGGPESALSALELAEDLADERPQMAETLELLLAWLFDQAVIASGASVAHLSNLDRKDELAELAERRGLPAILARTQMVMEAKRQLDMPYNFNALLIAEQLTLALAGHSRQEIVDRR